MLRNPADLASNYDSHVPVSEVDEKRLIKEEFPQENNTERIYDFSVYFGMFSKLLRMNRIWHSRQFERISAKSMEDLSFTPSQQYLGQCTALPEIQRDFGDGSRSVTAYLVVDVKIAAGLRTFKKLELVWSEPATAGVPHMSEYGEREDPLHDGNVVYPHSVREYILTSVKRNSLG
jgi:hypothetical protein